MVRFASSAPAPSGLNASRQEVWKEHHLLHHISYLIVLSGCNRLCFTNAPTAQSTRKLIPDRLAVTSPSAQVLLSWLPLHELAHDEDHARGSEEEPRVNRTAEGNAGDEPRRRQPIQEEVAHTKQSGASLSRSRSPDTNIDALLPLRECSASGRSSATRPAVTSPRPASVSPDSMR